MLAILVAAAVSSPLALPAPPEGWTLRGDAARGKVRFEKTCALCHGIDGSGNGKIVLDPPARDLRDPKARAHPTDWGTYVVVRDGGAATGLSPRMIAYGKIIDDEELHDVVSYVQSLIATGQSTRP